jgi:ribosome-associated heat shock protein Hsp15
MSEERIRIDKWLWAARFYKHRKLAQEAIAGGHIHLNGQRIKPAHGVKIGDELEITKENLIYIITVTALAEKRGSASVAAKLYHESEASIHKRQEQTEMLRLLASTSPRPAKRPDKKQRRKIIQFKQ